MKTIFAFFLSLLCASAFAGPDDMVFTQRNSADTGQLQRMPPHPTTSPGLFLFDTSTNLISWAVLDPSLIFSSGIISAAPQAWTTVTGKPSFATVATSGLYSDLSGRPSLSAVATSGDYADLTGKPAIPSAQVNSDWNAVSGAAQIMNKPTIPTVTAFNFGFPAAKTVVTGTSYQAADPTKPSVITTSAACSNNSTLLAANPCTLTVRVHTSAVTCSTGTIVATLSAVVNLGLIITQQNTTPVQVNLPATGHVIYCATAGTWAITAVEQTAN